MENNENLGNTNWTPPVNTSGYPQEIPGATASLTMGIIGLAILVFASCFPGTFVLGIIAFAKARRAMKLYELNPGTYITVVR